MVKYSLNYYELLTHRKVGLVAANVDGLLLCWYFIIVSLATEAD